MFTQAHSEFQRVPEKIKRFTEVYNELQTNSRDLRRFTYCFIEFYNDSKSFLEVITKRDWMIILLQNEARVKKNAAGITKRGKG